LPTPSPMPTPDGLRIDEVTGNYITADSINFFPWEGGVCPAEFRNSLSWVGIAFTNEVPVVPCTKDPVNPCLGVRINGDATPHSVPPFCYHHTLDGQIKVNRCEQARACIAPDGPDFWMFNAHWSGAEPGDKHSSIRWKVHHVPRKHETGRTAICAVPAGSRRPTSEDAVRALGGRCFVKDVRP
jgi:hypothetical protein